MTITAESIPGYVAGTWKLDPTHTEVGFTVRHLAISKVRGAFETVEGVVHAAETPSTPPSRSPSTSRRSTPTTRTATSTCAATTSSRRTSSRR
nr:YceI family protein [Microcella daejeonensis]